MSNLFECYVELKTFIILLVVSGYFRYTTEYKDESLGNIENNFLNMLRLPSSMSDKSHII